MTLQCPWPYWGGKRTVAHLVWQALGDPANYVECFGGSAAVLLARPHDPKIETLNDADGLVQNAWRSIKHDPNHVAYYADWAPQESEMHARHAWLVARKESLQARLEGNPDWYDAKAAGYWVYSMCLWIGSGFCSGNGPWQVVDGQLLHLGDAGQGVHRQLLHLGNAGQGVHRQLLHLGDAGQGVHRKRVHLGGEGGGVGVHKSSQRSQGIYTWMEALAERLRYVRVCCGDWRRVLGPSVTTNHGLTGVFLDPPYSHAEREKDLYRVEADISEDVRTWAIEHGHDPLIRIVLAGYAGHDAMPSDWTAIPWKAVGGYGLQGNGRGRDNATRERLWLSPHCLKVANQQMGLFDAPLLNKGEDKE